MMAILPLVTGEKTAVLRRRAQEITKFNPRLEKLVQDMYETMFKAKGVGLAAPQIGKSIRLFVAKFDHGVGRHELLACVNPIITARAEETMMDEEGCLSLPGLYDKIPRATWLELEYQDLKGKKQTRRFEHFNARIVCHETDHLEGILYIDHLAENAAKK